MGVRVPPGAPFWDIIGLEKRDTHQNFWGCALKIRAYGEQVQKERRTSSKGAENKFSAYGEQVQKERRTCSKFLEMRIKENSLAYKKNPLGKITSIVSLHF